MSSATDAAPDTASEETASGAEETGSVSEETSSTPFDGRSHRKYSSLLNALRRLLGLLRVVIATSEPWLADVSTLPVMLSQLHITLAQAASEFYALHLNPARPLEVDMTSPTLNGTTLGHFATRMRELLIRIGAVVEQARGGLRDDTPDLRGREFVRLNFSLLLSSVVHEAHGLVEWASALFPFTHTVATERVDAEVRDRDVAFLTSLDPLVIQQFEALYHSAVYNSLLRP